MDRDRTDILAVNRRTTLTLGARILSLLGISAAVAGTASVTAKKRGKGKKKRGKGKKKGRPVQLQAADMTGAKELDPITLEPNDGDLNASGSGTFIIRPSGTICANFTFSDPDNSPVIAFHIHEGDSTQNGPPVVNFNGQLVTCVPIANGLANQIKANPGGFYANIHTDDFPNGAVRDQLSAV